MRLANESDVNNILKLLKFNIENNLYLYIDLVFYGINSDFIDVWIKEINGSIKQIVLRYYNSFQIFSKYDDYVEINNLVNMYKPDMISGSEENIMQLQKKLNHEYTSSYGYVLEQKIDSKIDSDLLVDVANVDDLHLISKLICTDVEIGGHYNTEELTAQLLERMSSGMGRNYIIRDNSGKEIIAHVGTYAELDDIAVIGGLIVRNEYRNLGLGKTVYSNLIKQLRRESKDVYLFCNDENYKFYKSMGADLVANYGTLKRRK